MGFHDPIWRAYFSNGLKPQGRYIYIYIHIYFLFGNDDVHSFSQILVFVFWAFFTDSIYSIPWDSSPFFTSIWWNIFGTFSNHLKQISAYRCFLITVNQLHPFSFRRPVFGNATPVSHRVLGLAGLLLVSREGHCANLTIAGNSSNFHLTGLPYVRFKGSFQTSTYFFGVFEI